MKKMNFVKNLRIYNQINQKNYLVKQSLNYIQKRFFSIFDQENIIKNEDNNRYERRGGDNNRYERRGDNNRYERRGDNRDGVNRFGDREHYKRSHHREYGRHNDRGYSDSYGRRTFEPMNDKKPTTNWGQRYNRNNNLCFNAWRKGEKLIREHNENITALTEEEKELIFDPFVAEKIKIYLKNNELKIKPEIIHKNKLEDLSIHPIIVENLKKIQLDRLAPIQSVVLPLMKEKYDIVGCAQTGSGKTFAFLIPIVNSLLENGPPELNDNNDSDNLKLSKSISQPLAMILAPTRELAEQIYNEIYKITHETGMLNGVFYGGKPMDRDLDKLRIGVDIIVATPGRLNDLLERGKISLSKIKTVVLDEADRMLDMGFAPQLDKIFKNYDLPSKNNRQNVMFSATFDKEVRRIAENYLNEYYFVGDPNENITINKNIFQKLIYVKPFQRFDYLMNIVKNFNDEKIIIFCERKVDCKELKEDLSLNGIKVETIHGDLDQRQRDNAIKAFKSNKVNVLVATDVAARGMDFNNIELVINYELPKEIDSYIHRIGRTGRKGRDGKAISFVNDMTSPIVLRKIKEIFVELNFEFPEELNRQVNGFKNRRI